MSERGASAPPDPSPLRQRDGGDERDGDPLAASPIFGSASPAARARLAAAGQLRRYAPGEVILAEGDPARSIYALEEGMVRVFYSSPNGEQVVAKLFRAPAIFGEAEALTGIHHLENVDALDPVAVRVFPVEAVLTLLAAEPACALALLTDVAGRLAIAAYNEKSLAFHPVTIRLANFLLDYAEWSHDPGDSEWRISLTQDDMAASLGVTRRSIAKDVIAWQEEGILLRRGKHYLVRDVEALRRYTDPERLALTYSLARRQTSSR